MIHAKLIEISEKNRIHDLEHLLSQKSEIVIGRRNPDSAVQADICLGEDKKGKLLFFPVLMRGISSRQAVITYENENYYIQDCSANGTTMINDGRLKIGEKRVLETGAYLHFGENKYGPVKFLQDFAGNSDKI